VKPLVLTLVVVTGHHLAVRGALAEAVQRLVFAGGVGCRCESKKSMQKWAAGVKAK